MKLKSKYSLVGIIAACVAMLVMFLPCLNGVSIMEYVWYPAENETELFKAPMTKGLVRYNGSLTKVEDLASKEVVLKADAVVAEIAAGTLDADEVKAALAEAFDEEADSEETEEVAENAAEETNGVVAALVKAMKDAVAESEKEDSKISETELAANKYVVDYKIYMAELKNREVEYEAASAKYEADATTVEVTKKIVDVAIAKYNSPVEEANRVYSALDAAINDNEAKLSTNLDVVVNAYNKIQKFNKIKADLESAAKVLVKNYESADKLVAAAKETGAKVEANTAAAKKAKETITEAESRIVDINYNIHRIEKEFSNITTAKQVLIARSGEPSDDADVAAAKAEIEEFESANQAIELRKEYIPGVEESDKAAIADDISVLEAVYASKQDEEAAFKAEMEALNTKIAEMNSEIAKCEAEIAELSKTADYQAYKVALVLDGISKETAKAKTAIAEAKEIIRKSIAFAPVYTKEALAECVAPVAGLEVELKDVIDLADSASVAAKANVKEISLDEIINGSTDSAAVAVAEILKRDFYNTYFNNADLILNDEADSTFAASAKEISKIIYVDPKTKLAIYEYFLDGVKEARRNHSEYAGFIQKKSANEDFETVVTGDFNAAKSDFDSFVEEFETARQESDFYAISNEYLELKKAIFESNVTIKEDKVANKETESELKKLEKVIAGYETKEIFAGKDRDGIQTIVDDVKAYKAKLEAEEKVADYITPFKYYANAKNSNDMVSYVESIVSYLDNVESIESNKEEIESEIANIAKSEEDIANLKESKGLIECQLPDGGYKEMYNNEEIQISWYNYFINNEVSFFLYIMILFVVVVLFGLFVKFWQMNAIANGLLALVFVITVIASDLLYVGSCAIWCVFVLCAVASVFTTVMICVNGKKNGNE